MERGRGRQSDQRSKMQSQDRSRSRSRDRPAGARLADKRVYISNIPYDSRWQDIKDLFRNEVGEVSFVELFNDHDEKPRGCGVIEFESSSFAKKAIEKMHRFELGGRKIVVKEDYDLDRDKYGRIVTTGGNGSSSGGGSGGGGSGAGSGGGGGPIVRILRDRERSRDRDRDRDRSDWDGRSSSPQTPQGWKYGNTYGLSQQFLESLSIDGSLIPKVFVSNLDFRVDEKKLKEVFRLAGRVLFVDVNKDKDGKSRGHGTIEFEHPVEAVQAISMFNNQQLFDRRMHVKMDRLADPIADLAKNRLPEGLKSIGMGLGQNGQPLVDVARSLPSTTASTGSSSALVGGGSGIGATSTGNLTATVTNPLAAMGMAGMGMGVGGLTTMMTPQSLEGIAGLGVPTAAAAAAAAAANAFGVNMGSMATLTSTPNPFANTLQMNNAQANTSGNPMLVNPTNSLNVGSGPGGAVSVGNSQQQQTAQFQSPGNTGGNLQGASSQNFHGYSNQVYSNPSNYSSFQGDSKPNFGNGVSGHGHGHGHGQGSNIGRPTSIGISNTCIITNLPPSCTWQMLKNKFRECGDVVFAEKKNDNIGIVRFANDRDAERALKVFDQSRVDGRIVDVRFL